MSDNTILGTKPFSDYMSVAEAASKVMNLDEHCGICDEQGLKEETTPKQMSSDEKLKWFNKLKSGQTIKLWYDSSMAKGSAWREFKLGRKTKSAKYNLEKISMQMMKDGKAGGVKFFLYNRQGKISMAWGDMGVTLVSIKEKVEATRMPMQAPFILIDEVLKPGAKVKVPHPAKGKGMVTGKIVRYDKGGPESPFYIVDIGEPRSEKIPAHKIKEEVEIDEATVLQMTDVDQWTHEIYKGIDTGWKSVSKSTLGGDKNVAIMIKLTLEPEKDWPNKILQNARFAMIRIATDGTMEMFASHRNLKNMRRTKIKSAKDVVSKINTWIKQVDEEVEIKETVSPLSGKPFEDLRGVADVALKIMTGQPQEVKEEEKEEVTKEEQPQQLTEQIV